MYDNYHMFPIGSRAAGMGGAYTALGCDEAAIHYNPAALACSGSSRLELAANAYQLQGLSIADAFGSGEDVNALTFHSLPSIAGGVRVLIDGDEQTGAGALVFGLSVEVPHSLALTVDPAQPSKPNFFAFTVRDNLTTADVGLAYQFNEYFALGLTIGGGMRNYEDRWDFSLFGENKAVCPGTATAECDHFVSGWLSKEVFSLGLRGKLGMRITPTKQWALGLTVISPTIDIYGSSKVTEVNGWALPFLDGAGNPIVVHGSTPTRLTGDSNLALPFRLVAGPSPSPEK